MRRFYALLTLLLLSSITVTAQEFDTVRVCTYNILNFGTSDNARERMDELRMILNEIQPDILLVQDLSNEEGHNLFADSVAALLTKPLVPTSFKGANQDSYSAVFYSPDALFHQRPTIYPDTPRAMFTVRIAHRSNSQAIVIMTAHWKAGDTDEDEEMRALSGERLRYMGRSFEGSYPNVLFGGDLNVFSAFEPGYELIAGPVQGPFNDPINRQGVWHDRESFADIHTQSPRVRQFGDGDDGGMDDRFDQILLSDSLIDTYVPGSYTTFGNDGQHFNDSINALPNLAVGPVMAQALHDASDHLPVYLDLLFLMPPSDVPHQISDTMQLDLVEGL